MRIALKKIVIFEVIMFTAYQFIFIEMLCSVMIKKIQSFSLYVTL